MKYTTITNTGNVDEVYKSENSNIFDAAGHSRKVVRRTFRKCRATITGTNIESSTYRAHQIPDVCCSFGRICEVSLSSNRSRCSVKLFEIVLLVVGSTPSNQSPCVSSSHTEFWGHRSCSWLRSCHRKTCVRCSSLGSDQVDLRVLLICR